MHLKEGGEEGGSLSVAVVMLVLARVLDDDEEVEVEVETFLLSALILVVLSLKRCSATSIRSCTRCVGCLAREIGEELNMVRVKNTL